METRSPSNRKLTMARLLSTARKLENIEKYHNVMVQQLEQGILELVPKPATGQVIHYMPYQPVIREEAQSAKMRIVYDCSAKSDPQSPSLNDCLEVGPPLQPMILDIMLRNRMHKYCMTRHIKELVAAHMLSRLMNHVKQTLENQPIKEYHCWVDCTTVLYWIKGQGT